MAATTTQLLIPFYKGHSLDSEFGFVNYYHSHRLNRFLHTIAVPILVFALLSLLQSIDSRLAFLFSIVYCILIALIHYKCGLAYVILFGILYGPATVFSHVAGVRYGLLLFSGALSLQGIGHFVFQRASPAFRLFEAVFTTPAFLMMNIITDRNDPFWQDVEKQTNQWRTILEKNKT